MSASLDVLIPVFNEEEVLVQLFPRLLSTFSTSHLQQADLNRVRFIFIDDGSKDQTAQIIASHIRKGFPGLLLRLSRNFGHQNALTAGLDHADADFIAILDADLQDPPELVLQFIAKLREGYDVVYGQRRSRRENLFKRTCYWLFYRFLLFISDVPIPVDAGDFCVIRKKVLDALNQLPEKLRFHRGLRSWVGFRQVAYPYDRPERKAGTTKYSFRMLYQLATNGVASLSTRPLVITQGLLFFSLIATIGFFLIAFQSYRSANHSPEALRFLVTQALIVFTSSLQLFSLYILGAYIGRTYLETKARPAYLLIEKVGQLQKI